MRKKVPAASASNIAVVEHIEEAEIQSLLDDNYMRYTFAVMEDRALPDARDGLKPSQRRILYAMHELRLTTNNGKCALIAGHTSGHYHPHGEAVIYPTLVRMAQDWLARYPMVAKQGNFGNLDGDPPAAMRYTEARLSRLGATMLTDLSEDTIDHMPNYTEQTNEPTVLPALFPNLICNGGSGIAVGVATSMAPHNLREVVAAIKAYIYNRNMTVDELLAIMPGPDFPIPCTLRGQAGVRSYYETGRGGLQFDGHYEVIQTPKGAEIIRITSLPPGGSPEAFCVKLKTLLDEKAIEGIQYFEDLTKRDKKTGKINILIEVEVTKGSSSEFVITQLLKLTCLRNTFNVNQTVLIGGRVVENAPMLKLIESFVFHRKDVLTRRFQAELAGNQKEVHILVGLLNVAKNIDAVIKLIRASEDADDAIQKLIANKFVWTEEQAKAVLAITLRKLTKLETNELQERHDNLVDRNEWLELVLSDVKKLMKEVVKEQEALALKYGDDRRTEIGINADDIDLEDLIKEEQIVVSLTKDGYIKRIPVSAYNVQNRGGKGVMGVKSRDNDEADEIFVCSTHDIILFFTTHGLMYKKKGYQIPEAGRTGKGTHLANLLTLSQGETVTNTITLSSLDQDGYLIMVTKGGLIKRSFIRDYDTSLKTRGLQAIKLNDNDNLAFVERTDGKTDVFIATAKGMAIRYPENTVRPTGRVTAGVKALNLSKDDAIAQMLTIDNKSNPDILVVTSMGFGKRTESSQYRCLQGRYAKGVRTIDQVKQDRNGLIVGAVAVTPDDTLLVLTSKGKIIQMPVKQIRSTGRIAMGVKVVSLDNNDSVQAIVKVEDGMTEDED